MFRPLICYDLAEVSAFLRSVAMARAIDETTHLEWETYRDSAVLNAAYAVFFWKEPPGTVQVRSASWKAIEAKTDRYHADFLTTFLERAAEQGAGGAARFVDSMGRVKQASRSNTAFKYSEAASINSEIAGEVNDSIRKLAAIKLGATVGVAVIGAAASLAILSAGAAGAAAAGGTASLTALGMPLGASGTAFTVAGTTYSVTNSVISSWEDGPKAAAVAVTVEGAKSAANTLGTDALEKRATREVARRMAADKAMRSAEGTVRSLNARLTSKVLSRNAQAHVTKGIATASQTAARNRTAAQAAGTAARTFAGAARAVPVIFAAWDIYGAVQDFRGTLAETRR